MPLKPLELVQPRIVPAAIHNSLKSLVFSCTVPARYGIGRAKKSLRILKNRLEPFGQLRRLIGEQAEKAWITAPIGAHAPPIPCADQRDPPGFPRPGGSVFPPWVVSLGAGKRSLPPNSALPFGRSVMMSSDSVCVHLRLGDAVRRLSLLMRVSDGSMSARGCDPALLCRRGYPHMHSRRLPRNGARLPSVAVRTFSSFMREGAGSITTAGHSSSIGYARPFA